MANGDNKIDFEAGAPKKADVLIRSTQYIAIKQEELSEQTKQAVSRIEEAIGLFSKNNDDSVSVIKQCSEVFGQLQEENAALKQELLYLAKQSENIYSVLAEKINELNERSKAREQAISGIADKIDNTADKSASESVYENILGKLNELSEQNKNNEKLYEELSEKLNALSGKLAAAEKQPVEFDSSELMSKLNYISEQIRRSEGAHSMLADKFEILSMRVDQYGLENSKNAYQQVPPVAYQPVQAVPVPTVVKEDIDYDKLAEKVASLISAREVVSPDYIASRVAEQIVLPGTEAAHVNVNVDSEGIARQVADLINVQGVRSAAAPAQINIDEEGLAERLARKINIKAEDIAVANAVDIDEVAIADRLAEKLGGIKTEEVIPAPVDLDEESLAQRLADKLGGLRNGETTVVIDEEALAEKIANRVGSFKANVVAPVGSVNIDEDELADAISLKVGSLKSEDFEILVDDDGCGSISKGIADSLDYERISGIIADKLREVLDLAAVNAPDYEEMAERISEKITVAGINEDAIADKAAAVLSNYLPDFDTDEITDKITGAVIDVVSAMPQPTVDTEAICNAITERLIESQEDHDYDIVIDDDGISRITELVAEEIEKQTVARFDSLDSGIDKLTEIITSGETQDETVARFDKVDEDLAKIYELLTPAEEEVEEVVEETEEELEEPAFAQDYTELTALMSEEIQKGTASRFDKVEEEIAKLSELITSTVVPEAEEELDETEEYAEDEETYEEQDDYIALSEVVAAEIEKGVSVRLDAVEQNIEKLCELVSGAITEEEAEETEEGETVEDGEEYEETYEEEDYSAFTEIVAAEIEKGVSPVAVRLDSVEENIAKISEILSSGVRVEETHAEDKTAGTVAEEPFAVEADYTELSEIVATEIEKGVSPVSVRLDSVEESIAKISEILSSGGALKQPDGEEYEEYEEFEDYSAVSNAVTYEVVNALSERFENIEKSVAKLTDMLSEGIKAETSEEDYTKLSETVTEGVSAEIQKTVSVRLDSVEENLAKVAALIAGGISVQSDESGVDYSQLAEVMTNRVVSEVSTRLQTVEENIAKITDIVESGVATEVVTEKYEEDFSAISEVVSAEIEKGVSNRLETLEENIAKISEIVSEKPVAVSAEVQPADIENALKERFDKVEEEIAKITALIEGTNVNPSDDRIDKMQEEIAKISAMVANGVAVQAVTEVATAQYEQVETVVETEEEEALVTVSDLVKPEEIAEEESEDEEDDGDDDSDDDFLIDVLDMDRFSDNELMPGELSDYAGGVDFANMMKFKRSFIARIIQSSDDYKQYYGEVKHALLSYRKVNSNVAWGAERFNKGRETVARMKIRGKTLCLYLALDPNEYKTSVYHHLDVSDNRSVAGTPMMVKIKSNLGVRKAIRLIDEMLAKRNGEKREIPERDYAVMYPYETIEELIEDGLVKDVRKK